MTSSRSTRCEILADNPVTDADAAEQALEARLEALRQNPEASSTPVAAETETKAEADPPDEGGKDAEAPKEEPKKADPTPDASKPETEKDGEDEQTVDDKADDAPKPPPGMTWKAYRQMSRDLDKSERERRRLEDELAASKKREEQVALDAKANGYELDVAEDAEPTDADLKEAVDELGPKMGKAFHLSRLESWRARQELADLKAQRQGGGGDPKVASAIEENEVVYDWLVRARTGDSKLWDLAKEVDAGLKQGFKTEAERIAHIQAEVERRVKEEAERIAAQAKSGTADPATPARSLSNAPGTTGEGNDVERFLAMTREQRIKYTDELQDNGQLDKLQELMRGIQDRDAA